MKQARILVNEVHFKDVAGQTDEVEKDIFLYSNIWYSRFKAIHSTFCKINGITRDNFIVKVV